MRVINFKTILKRALQGATALLLGTGMAAAQPTINLTAGPTTTVLPDGTSVPMWSYFCGAATNGAMCAAMNQHAGLGWSPVVITVPVNTAGATTLQINLTNNLTFTANGIPTSIIIAGQIGGGLGEISSSCHAASGGSTIVNPAGSTCTPSPTHGAQEVTWPIADTGATNVPPPQGPRVQSFGTEVAASKTTSLTWSNLKPGTYLLESGTHSSIQVPMGLYGVLVVTTAPTSTATTVGGTATTLESTAGCAYYTPGSTTTCAIPYDAEVPLAFGEIDPVQNKTVSAAVNTAGFSETAVWSGQPGGCGNSSSATYLTCYPPAVNYTPLYYMINGVPFSKTSATNSVFPISPGVIAPAAGAAGNVLVRMVNAGLKMHVPSIVGSQVAGQTGATNPVVTGFKIVAEDGFPLPGVPRVKSEAFMAASKTYDVMINGLYTPATGPRTGFTNALSVFDRELSLSGNAVERDAGMLAYIGISPSAAIPASPAITPAIARPDPYHALVAGITLNVSDPEKGVIANDTNVYGVTLLAPPTNGTVTLNANGTFTYVPSGTATSDTFTYCANGTVAGGACSSGITALVTLSPSNIVDSGITCAPQAFTSTMATYLAQKTPGVLAGCKDGAGLPLTVVTTSITASGGMTVLADSNGGFTASAPSPGVYTFTFQAKNSDNVLGPVTTATLNFPKGSGLNVTVLDGLDKATVIGDYRWIIEEDQTFYNDPNCSTNPPPAGCPAAPLGVVPALALNFHTSHMPYVAQGCTGPLSCEGGQTVLGSPAVCDLGDGACRPDATGNGMTPVLPSQVALDPTKRYYISVLPGDAADPFAAGYAGGGCQKGAANSDSGSTCGHGMGGATINPPCAIGTASCTTPFAPVSVISEPSPYPPGKLSVQVFEDDFPLNGEQDAGGGVDILATNEPGLGGFNIVLWDVRGQFGDAQGQMTYDMFNQPLSNSLAGTIDPATGADACPISPEITANMLGTGNVGTNTSGSNTPQGTQQGLTGMIVTCPKYESDGKTMSPLAGEAVIANLMPLQVTVQAYPGADRIARGEQWVQTNTLDGQHPHDAFVKIGEPAYFQEYGPAGFHVSVGFANPAIINARHAGVCKGTDLNLQASDCTNTVTGKVTMERLSRPPDERLYSSGSRAGYFWSQCWVSLGDPDGEDFIFTNCDDQGNFTLTGVPSGAWRMTLGDQWNDQIVDGLSTPVGVPTGNNQTIAMGDIATQQWQSNVMTRTFMDDDKSGVWDSSKDGIPFLNTTVRYRDGSMANNLLTDFTGSADFNETFPLFNWYVVETDNTRYKTTGTHTVYDVGGPTDGSASCGTGSNGNPACGPSNSPYAWLANTYENLPLPANLSVPGAIYCPDSTCSGQSIWTGVPVTSSTTNHSAGRIDPPWVYAEGWQGQIGQFNFIEFGKAPYAAATSTSPAENGGIRGHVVYASTRPFDDPQLNVQQPWEPLVPHVTMNLYKEGLAVDGVTPTLTLVDTTQTSSWDDWAQGFRSDGVSNMNCPGQGMATGTNADLFFYSIYNQPNYLDFYNNFEHGTAATPTPLPYNSQYKCYDGMHNWNQLQPAAYDGVYGFPSVLGVVPNGANAGKLNTALTGGVGTPGTSTYTAANMPGTNCTICIANPDSTDPWRSKTPMLPAGKYVVEVVLPPGYELVKEEDKNILIGDNFIAPVTQQFGGLGNIFIIPDQASVASSQQYPGPGYNANNAQNPTQSLGTVPENNFVPGFLEPTWPCVGEAHIVPDYISLFPQSQEVAPFAGATRNLCDRKEVTLSDQTAATAKFYIYTSTHIASKYTGIITDDFTNEFDPFAPTFGEKFSPPNQPVSTRDWNGTEISRVYSDLWGAFDGMTYSTWEVNPPNPTGYSPSMMVQCMNDAGPILDTRAGSPTNGQMITDPLFNPLYSQFCYEDPYMPGQTGYLDTPVVPTAAFVGAGYNNPDCSYPDLTPAVAEVDGDGVGPWVNGPGHNITITALGDQVVNNYGYAGPQSKQAPFNQKTITRHYGFGTQCTSPAGGSATCNTASAVTVGGATATIVSWSDTQIVATLPGNVPQCIVQQQVQYGNPNTHGAPGQTTRCGELVITAGNGKQSIDSVTVTVGGKAPTHVAASDSVQAAIDAAAPGDLIIVDPTCTTTTAGVSSQVACTTTGATRTGSTHRELLIMWKPIRLQGVGAASTIIDASTHPAGSLKLDPWRRSVNCLFGLAMNGQPASATNPFDSPLDNNGQPYTCPSPGSPTASGMGPNGNTWKYFYGGPNYPQMVVDRIPLEGILGWDTTVNGNLAEQLQEPSLMGAYEGSAVTVLAKGVNIPAGSSDVFGSGAEAGFPTGSTLLIGTVGTSGGVITGDSNSLCHTSLSNTTNPYPSNFMCNPSSIDGLGITDASQGGGGIFLHAWTHEIQIANNRVYNNSGTLSGGLTIGQGEFPEAYLAPTDFAGAGGASPGSCQNSPITNTQLPYCQQLNVSMHNNMVTYNSSVGDELFTGTPAGAGGVSICTGSDYYKFNYNWVCGNMSTGDGGGVAHIGFSYDGDIEHNSIVFNQSINPTIQTNGGGLIIMGAAPDGTTLVNGVAVECGSVTDNDCVPGLTDGTGPGLTINANLIQGNSADSGSGGGLRLQAVNGADVSRFPANPERWYHVAVTNNIIDNNVAGWDGAGVSLEDSLAVALTNNTIASNDTTSSSGALFNTLGAPLASSQSPTPACLDQHGGTASCPQPAGLVSMQNSPQLTSSFTTGKITCPAGNYAPGTPANGGTGAGGGTCIHISYPALNNNLLWQNHAFQIGIGPIGTGAQNQQYVVSLYNANFTGGLGAAASSQAYTGACPSGSSYWDLGVRNDKGPANHASGFTLNPVYGVLTSTTGYSNTNLSSNPSLVGQYCNGSRVPPEAGGLGWQVPAGIADSVVPNPIFSLTPTATVDEGNNWVNMSWGPLSLTNPSISGADGDWGGGPSLGNYTLSVGSPAIDHVPVAQTHPTTDFFGNPRPDPANPRFFDVGAVEFVGSNGTATLSVTGGPLAFGNQVVGTTSSAQTLTLHNTGTGGATSIAVTVAAPFARAGGTCGATLAAASTCTITVDFAPTVSGPATGSLTIAANVSVSGSPVSLSGTGVAPVVSASLTPTSWTVSHARNCPGTGFAGIVACNADPSQTFTLANTGNVTLTGIAQATLGGTATNIANYTIVRLFSTCGPTGNGQLVANTTLAPGATCAVTVQFKPLTSQATGLKPATVSVSDAAGTQTSTLNGTAQ